MVEYFFHISIVHLYFFCKLSICILHHRQINYLNSCFLSYQVGFLWGLKGIIHIAGPEYGRYSKVLFPFMFFLRLTAPEDGDSFLYCTPAVSTVLGT